MSADPMTTATAEMFLRQRDEALAEVGVLRETMLMAADKLEMFGNEEPAAVASVLRRAACNIGQPDERDFKRGLELAREHGWA